MIEVIKKKQFSEVFMDAVILFGSPRRDGNTFQLVKAFSETLKEKGINLRMLYLNDMNLRPCQGCGVCLPNGVCRINDDMKDILKYMKESDLIVYATPVYWFGVSSQLKLAIDRTFALMDETFNSRIAGKKAVTIMSCGTENAHECEHIITMFKMIFDLLKLEYKGSLIATGCPTNTVAVKDEFIKKAKELALSVIQ